uniref:Uncharacterized protein n=1 Tax=Panagrolaimus sp. ES5 TaxID=591445 RepID=A0AC34FJ36_9BILA
MPAKFNETHPTKIYSNQQSAACGMELPENKEFLLVGYESADTLSGPVGSIGINVCSYLDAEFEKQLRNSSSTIDCSHFKKD